jgi:hypothetical protein
MKKVIVVISLLTSLIGGVDKHPTMTLLTSKSSVILSDYEGEFHFYHNPSMKQWKLRQITETQFMVLLND